MEAQKIYTIANFWRQSYVFWASINEYVSRITFAVSASFLLVLKWQSWQIYETRLGTYFFQKNVKRKLWVYELQKEMLIIKHCEGWKNRKWNRRKWSDWISHPFSKFCKIFHLVDSIFCNSIGHVNLALYHQTIMKFWMKWDPNINLFFDAIFIFRVSALKRLKRYLCEAFACRITWQFLLKFRKKETIMENNICRGIFSTAYTKLHQMSAALQLQINSILSQYHELSLYSKICYIYLSLS